MAERKRVTARQRRRDAQRALRDTALQELGGHVASMVARGKIAKRESRQEKFERRQAQIGLASNVLGLTAAGAATATALRSPALRRPSSAEAGPVTGRVLRRASGWKGRVGRVLRTPKGRAALVGGGAGAALGLQVANLGGDLVANRVLAREAKVDKSFGQERLSDVGFGRQGSDTGVNLERVEKAKDDKFLQRHRVRISPDAEVGYNRLRELRGKERALATVSAAGATSAAAAGFSRPKSWPLLALPVVAGSLASHQFGRNAGRLNGRMDKIKAKAYERAETGELAPGRRLLPKDVQKSGGVAKRSFNAEADRQRRLGAYGGAGIGAGLVLGDLAYRSLPEAERYDLGGRTVKVRDFRSMPRNRKLRLAGLAAGAGLAAVGGSAALLRGRREANNPWQ